ncbi:hypothetical protein GF361_02530 [Candidatus Woesearchaeota archaeon]|nr:hypothetical protein [Candidatus Woesearchaeota archaeon]
MPRKKSIRPEQYFSLCTGGLIKDLKELVYTLDYLSEGELKHHVNENKNDFSTWVSEVFKEPELAEKLATAEDKKDMQIALLKHLVTKRQRS